MCFLVCLFYFTIDPSILEYWQSLGKQLIDRSLHQPNDQQLNEVWFCNIYYSAQFSIFNFGTLENSLVLLVTTVSPKSRAWDAIQRSFTPIIFPFNSK